MMASGQVASGSSGGSHDPDPMSNMSSRSLQVFSPSTSIPDSFKSELYFMICQFLESNPDTQMIADDLKRQLTDKKLLTPRYDWTGRSHPKTFADVQHEVGPLPPEHLLEICFRLSSVASSSTSIRSLLGRHTALVPPQRSQNFLRVLSRQDFGVQSLNPRQWHERLTRKMAFLRRTLGHLSCVYCLAFDRTGRYVFTGADDLLVKCWKVSDGRLIHTFRGASSEISDLAISHDNRLLAAGSCDKMIRVWCLQTASPVAVLSKHTGMITAIHFCAFSADDQEFHLASTSGDGTVSFWRYHFNEHDVAQFDEAPTRYHEKIRPGQAQMLCASFSPGGVFFCVGSADHNVRVYQMNCPEGPQRILEEEVHQDRVSCIQWCNQSDQLRFISGSKDGTAIIWSYRAKKWQTLVLNMKTGDNQDCAPAAPKTSVAASSSRGRGGGSSVADSRPNAGGSAQQQPDSESRVTMVAWSLDDSLAITAVSDTSLKLWDARTGQLRATLKGHEDEIFVLEPHPTAWNLLLSAAHDGYIMIWDLDTKCCLFKYKNIVEEGTGHAPVYDAKWSPDGLTVAASDSHGHLLFVGHGSTEKYDKLPVELFFHTDYRPLLRDSFQNVVDEQTQVPPHLLPAPFLVDSEGSPYPAYIQKFVPGREKMAESEALLPGGPEPSFNIDNMPAAAAVPGPSGRNRRGVQQELQQEVQLPFAAGGQPLSSPDRVVDQMSPRPDNFGLEFRVEDQRPGNSAAVNSSVVVAKREVVRKELSGNGVREHLKTNKDCSALETEIFVAESNKTYSEHDYTSRSGLSAKDRHKKVKNSAGRRGQQAQPRTRRAYADDDDDDEEEENEPEPVEEGRSDSSLDESDLSSVESTTEEDTSDHSYWGSDGHEDQEENAADIAGPPVPPSKKKSPKNKKKRTAAQRCKERLLRSPGDISEEFMPSPWLSESMPKKSPYFPQIGDVLMYFKRGHQMYLDLVKARKAYQVNMKEQEFLRKKNLNDFCLVKVENLKFEIRPPRLCILKLSLLNLNTRQPTGEFFSIKYHDMNDVVDFLVLYDIYKSSVEGKHWKNGDRIRCLIDDCWWKGTVKKIEHHDANKRSPFLSISCHWDNGEKEELSPWDIEALDQDTAEVADGTQVTPEQLKSCLYQPTEEEWNSMGLETECRRISEALETIMSLAIAEPFNYPVDLTAYPEYMLDVEYPMDLSLIKARIDSHFYRRIDAVLYDVRYIATNAANFNQPKSDIVKNSKIITKLTLEIVRDSSKTQDDVSSIYHRLVQSFEWSGKEDSDNSERDEDEDRDDEENSDHEDGRKSEHKSPQNLNPKKWKHDCNELLTKMVNLPFSRPFREPVSEIDFPDYHRCITTPMDISTVREFLLVGEYSSPLDFQKDVLMIFKNSREYNTEPKSKILSMTNKLEDWFDEHIHSVIHEWRKTNRRLTLAKRKHKLKKLTKGKGIVGKGKGKGKGQSNKISRAPRRDESNEEEEENAASDEDHVADHADEDGVELDSSPTRPVPSRSARAKRRAAAASSENDSESDDNKPLSGTSKALIARHKSAARAVAAMSSNEPPGDEPVPSTSRAAGTGSTIVSPASTASSSTQPKRSSSRVPKPNAKYLEDDLNGTDEDDDAPLSRKSSQRGGANRLTANVKSEEEGEEEGEEIDSIQQQSTKSGRASSNAAATNSSQSGSENARPKRQRKPLRSDNFKYFDEGDEEDGEEEDDEKPLVRRGTKRKLNGEVATAVKEENQDDSSSEDDVPLARKLKVPKQEVPKSEEKRQVTSRRNARMAKEEDDFEEDESSSEDDKPLKRSGGKGRGQRAVATLAKKKLTQLDVDSSEDSSGGNSNRRTPAGRRHVTAATTNGNGRKRKKSESDFDDCEEEDESEEEEEESDDETSDDDDDVSDNEPVSKSRNRNRPQRRSAAAARMQPKQNTSKRAAQALDSESEHTSTRRPSRLSNQNRTAATAATGGTNEESNSRRGAGRRSAAAAKRSYFESDNEDNDSARENRRPRRASTKRRPHRDWGSSEEEEDEESYDEGQPRKRKPNPRII